MKKKRKEIMDHHNEIDMEDSDYGHFFNNLDKFGYPPEGEIDMEDPNYAQYFNNLDKFSYPPEGEGDHDDDDDDEDEDPDYRFFVENLKQDENGGSYSVAIPISSDISIVLRYEEKEEESLENVDKRTSLTTNSTTEKAKIPQTLDGFSGKTRVGRLRTVKKTKEIRNDGSTKKLGGDNRNKRKDVDVPVQETNGGDDGNKRKEIDVPVQETNSGDDEILIDVPEILGSFPGKARPGRPKTVKKPLEVRDEGCKKMLRDVPCRQRKSTDNGNKRKEIDVPVQETNSGDNGNKRKEIDVPVQETNIGDNGNKRKEIDVPVQEINIGDNGNKRKEIDVPVQETNIEDNGNKRKEIDVPVQETNIRDDEILIDVPEILGSIPGKARPGRPKTVKKPLEIRDEGCKKMLRDVRCRERKSGDNGNKRKEIDEVDPVSCKSGGNSLKMMNCVVKEESCYEFPVSLDKSGMNYDPSYKKGHTSSGTHPENDGCCSDVEVFTLDNMPSHEGDYTPFVPSKCYQPLPGEEFGDGIGSSKPSQFRDQLMDLLKIPYDGHEFNNLWQDVTERKPVEGVKELRGRMKLYSTTTIGRSYLDWYKELRMKIDEFKHDQHKVLCLLRGFFFWLKNISHVNAFQPWLDKLYLKALTDHRL